MLDVRLATLDDVPALQILIATSARALSVALYGGDQMKGDIDPRLDPEMEPARIRAFFVHPAWARRGLARQLYASCASAALAAGFRRFELMATLPGVPLYGALGFEVMEPVSLMLPGDVALPLARMQRAIISPE